MFTPKNIQGALEELYDLCDPDYITRSYIVTFTCTCNVHQKSKDLLISSQSDGVKSL